MTGRTDGVRTWADDDIEAAVVESTERSGVPLVVEDPTVLRHLGRLRRSAAARRAS